MVKLCQQAGKRVLGQWEALYALRDSADPKGVSRIFCVVGWPRWVRSALGLGIKMSRNFPQDQPGWFCSCSFSPAIGNPWHKALGWKQRWWLWVVGVEGTLLWDRSVSMHLSAQPGAGRRAAPADSPPALPCCFWDTSVLSWENPAVPTFHCHLGIGEQHWSRGWGMIWVSRPLLGPCRAGEFDTGCRSSLPGEVRSLRAASYPSKAAAIRLSPPNCFWQEL